jgi:protein-histidine pros-kinase
MLESLGLQVSLVADGAAAFSAIERSRAIDFPYDYIFADAGMAAPAGFSLAENWRASKRAERLLVMLTTENQRQDLARLREFEVSAHLVKPIGAGDLADALALAEGKAAGLELAPFELDANPGAADKVLDILLVEDNPVNQELALRLLERKSHRVVLANNGAEAVEQFDSGRFDVILMDMQMPVMGGIEATEAIRSREMRRSWVVSHEVHQVYIIAMTANVMASDRDRCLDAGMNDFVAKPLRTDELFAALARACGEDSVTPALAAPHEEEGVLLDLKGAIRDIGDADLFSTMSAMLLSEWDVHLQYLQDALATSDQSALRMHSHTIKSLLAMLHAEPARRYAMEIEQAALPSETVDWSRCRQLCSALQDEMAQIKPLLIKFVETRVIP